MHLFFSFPETVAAISEENDTNVLSFWEMSDPSKKWGNNGH
jgi:hypothetical protein